MSCIICWAGLDWKLCGGRTSRGNVIACHAVGPRHFCFSIISSERFGVVVSEGMDKIHYMAFLFSLIPKFFFNLGCPQTV
ncbi:hypothetical protein DM860_015899 [Cuscuta australis]|uniref:Uncharacterized protein n=1 Tax=Cuscuta australis TaxID=267555 RepID=A0A328DYH5_9ASTE|nr:hypothetical protein DM860_015899 [Cuscuta australis]